MYPTTLDTSIPPIAPAMPPMPTTDPTALRGNISEVVVKRFADQPWCAAAASPTRSTAIQTLEAFAANTTGTTASAQINIAVLRARFIVAPRLIIEEESQPPATLPTSAIRYTVISGNPTFLRSIA